jgi:hypothetical protein
VQIKIPNFLLAGVELTLDNVPPDKEHLLRVVLSVSESTAKETLEDIARFALEQRQLNAKVMN